MNKAGEISYTITPAIRAGVFIFAPPGEMPERSFQRHPYGKWNGLMLDGKADVEFMERFYVYILRSELNGSHYYGHTNDLQSRLKSHNAGKVRSTKEKRPWKVLYFEQFATKSEAYRRELFFKSYSGYKFLKEKGIT